MDGVDYKKWLGPDWKPQWEGAGTLIFNHHSWMDILAALSIFYPSFVSKKSVKKYPFIGTIATAIDSVFLDRAGTKEEKKAAAI
jgi:1-acyl-sn-glycerol-3-phosphate acyltransferase